MGFSAMIIVPNPVINTYRNNKPKELSWYEYSEFDNSRRLHRLDGPARIYFRGNKSIHEIYSEMWYIHGRFHREDGPAFQSWYSNGCIKKEMWVMNNITHRNDGPAIIEWYRKNTIKNEYWYRRGKFHREYGPSKQEWDANGIITKEEWNINGVDISDRMNNIISGYNLPHWRKWASDERVLVKIALEI